MRREIAPKFGSVNVPKCTYPNLPGLHWSTLQYVSCQCEPLTNPRFPAPTTDEVPKFGVQLPGGSGGEAEILTDFTLRF